MCCICMNIDTDIVLPMMVHLRTVKELSNHNLKVSDLREELRSPGQSQAEPVRAELGPSQAGTSPSRTGQSQPEPVRAEPSRAELVRAWPRRALPVRAALKGCHPREPYHWGWGHRPGAWARIYLHACICICMNINRDIALPMTVHLRTMKELNSAMSCEVIA